MKNNKPHNEWEKLKVSLVKGVAGHSLYINDFRVNGEKPWGGGSIVYEAEIDLKDIPFITDLLTKALEEERGRIEAVIELYRTTKEEHPEPSEVDWVCDDLTKLIQRPEEKQ